MTPPGRSIINLADWQFKPFLSGGGYIHIYLAVYGQEIIGGFSLGEKVTK